MARVVPKNKMTIMLKSEYHGDCSEFDRNDHPSNRETEKSKGFIQTSVRGICIPTLPSNIDKNQLYRRFRCLNIGFIKNIVVVEKSRSHTAFITVSKWFNNDKARRILDFLEEDNPVYICNHFPEYLKCYVLKKKKE